MPLNTGPSTPTLMGVGSTTDVQPVSSTNPVPVAISATGNTLPTTPVFGQGTVGTSAAQLPSAVLKQGVTLTADGANTGNIFIGITGVTTGTGAKLEAGKSVFLSTDNLNRWFVIGSAASQSYSWAGS